MSPTSRCKGESNTARPVVQVEFGQWLCSLVRQGVRVVIEEVMQDELTAVLEAQRHERSPRRKGQRNGRYTRDLVTPVGVIEDLRVPRDRAGQFATQVFERYARRQDSVTDLLQGMVIRGVSEGQVGELVEPLLGVAPSPSTLSRVVHGLEAECTQWRKRPLLARYRVVYVDGVYFSIVHDEKADQMPLLVALGVNADGRKEVLSLQLVGAESTDGWQALADDLKARGVREIDLLVSDGDEGAIGVLERAFPSAKRQRCLTHKLRNVLARLPKRAKSAMAAALKDIFAQPTREEARERLAAFQARYEREFPEAVATLLNDIDACLTFYDFAKAMWKHIRTTNALEGLFSTVRRRTNKIGAFRNENSCVLFVYAVIQSVKFHRVSM